MRWGWLPLVLAGRLALAQSPVPEIVGAAAIDPGVDINFASGVWPRRVYTGQQATYQIGIFLGEGMRSRLRSNPQFVPPDVRSVIAYDLPLPGRLFARREGERNWDVHVYSRALFPVTPGRIDIAPAKLTWMVPLSNSIFAREESHNATSGSHVLEVLAPPAAGRPDGFSGAVGDIAVVARPDAAPRRVGDPFVLTVTVSGVGNVGLFPRPEVRLPWGHVVPGPERVRVDSSASVIRGDKSFEWVVTPRDSGRREVPAIRYPYFNPYTERYEVALTSPIPVTVSPGALVVAGESSEEQAPRPSVRRTLRSDMRPPLPTQPWYWLGFLVVPLPAMVQRWRQRVRPARVASPSDRLAKWAQVEVPDPVEVRRAFREALGHRIPGAQPVLTDPRGLQRTLRRAGVTLATAHDVRALLDELDASLYGGRVERHVDVGRRAHELVQRLDAEAVPVGAGRLRAGVSLVLLCAAALTGAAATDRDEAVFRQGLNTWDAGDAVGAGAAFRELAVRRPRAADAWMNAGTAAWVVGDTARAVEGWQRALRLEPMADDARARLVETPSFRDGLLGDIPPVPVDLLAVAAFACWSVAWGVAWRRREEVRWMPLAVAATVACVAVLATERHAGRRLVVVSAGEALRDLPAMSGAPGARVDVGETARVVSSQGAWHRVQLADGREGWIDGSQVIALDQPSAPTDR